MLVDNRRVFLISLMQNVIRFLRMKTPKRESPTFLRQSVELGFQVQYKLGNSQVGGIV